MMIYLWTYAGSCYRPFHIKEHNNTIQSGTLNNDIGDTAQLLHLHAQFVHWIVDGELWQVLD